MVRLLHLSGSQPQCQIPLYLSHPLTLLRRLAFEASGPSALDLQTSGALRAPVTSRSTCRALEDLCRSPNSLKNPLHKTRPPGLIELYLYRFGSSQEL